MREKKMFTFFTTHFSALPTAHHPLRENFLFFFSAMQQVVFLFPKLASYPLANIMIFIESSFVHISRHRMKI
jgi:hypothetical protein